MSSPRAPSSSRRALLAGAALSLAAPVAALAAVPSASPPPPDPHPAMLPALLALWREHRETDDGWGTPVGSPEHAAAEDAYLRMVEECDAIAEMPPPRTVDGLAALAVAAALRSEEYITSTADLTERMFATLLTATLAATGAEMPDDWRGLTYQPDAEPVAPTGEGA